LQENLGDTPTGAEDSRPDRNGEHSLDDNHQRPLAPDVQAAQNNTAETSMVQTMSGAQNWM